MADGWFWTKEKWGCYSVKSAHDLLLGPVIEIEDNIFHFLWSTKAFSNVLAVAWKMSMLSSNSKGFPSLCSQSEETSSYLFFYCPCSWKCGRNSQAYKWCGIATVCPNEGCAHFLQHLSVCATSSHHFHIAWSFDLEGETTCGSPRERVAPSLRSPIEQWEARCARGMN